MKKKKIFHLPINNLEVSRETIRKYELFHISSDDIYELPLEFPAGNFLDTGTLRNSFFTHPLLESKYSGELSLYLDIYGSCKVLIYYQSLDGSVHLLTEESYQNEDGVKKIPIHGNIQTSLDVLRYFYTINQKQNTARREYEDIRENKELRRSRRPSYLHKRSQKATLSITNADSSTQVDIYI